METGSFLGRIVDRILWRTDTNIHLLRDMRSREKRNVDELMKCSVEYCIRNKKRCHYSHGLVVLVYLISLNLQAFFSVWTVCGRLLFSPLIGMH